MNEKRSPDDGIAQLPLLPDLVLVGVGARQKERHSHSRGGGYLDVCTAQKVEKKAPPAEKIGARRDPRLDELREMGLQRPWIQAAEQIGVDAILTVWRILDADPSSSYDGTTLRVPLRSYRTFLRYQRNRYIEALREQGLKPQDIQRRLSRQFGERVSISHIKRLARRR